MGHLAATDPLTGFMQTGQTRSFDSLFASSSQRWQTTMCPHGRNTAPTVLSSQILQVVAFCHTSVEDNAWRLTVERLLCVDMSDEDDCQLTILAASLIDCSIVCTYLYIDQVQTWLMSKDRKAYSPLKTFSHNTAFSSSLQSSSSFISRPSGLVYHILYLPLFFAARVVNTPDQSIY